MIFATIGRSEVTLQIIGAALPRTGTLSLKFALEHLGFGPCYHMSEFICDPSPRWRWTFARWRPSLLDPLWEQFHATVDSPGCMLWRQLADRFPKAKVILTRRDPERWADSVLQTVARPEQAKLMLRSPLAPAILALPPFGMKLERESMIRHFERYGERVCDAIPRDRLLEFEAKDGWEPLCSFLGVPVPAMPYPRVNEREAMQSLATEDDLATLSFAQAQAAAREYLQQQRQSLFER